MTTKKSDTAGRTARGRPRSFDMDAAVDKAMGLFHAHGYDGVGVAELGKELGISAPSLYAAFGSKLGLFERAVAHYSSCHNLLSDPRVEEADGSVAFMEGLLLAAADFYAADPERRGCLVIESCRLSRDADARSVTAGFRIELRRELRVRFVADGVADPDGLIDYLMVALYGLSGAARDGMDRDGLRRVAQSVAAGARGYFD